MQAKTTATISAQNQGPTQVKLNSIDSPDASIAKLRDLEKALDAKIEKYCATLADDDKKNRIRKRLADDVELSKTSSLSQANDNDTSVKFKDDESRGLKDRQQKTKNLLEQDITNAQNQQEIFARLKEVHEMRLQLVQQELDKQDIEDTNQAIAMFDAYTGRTPPTATARPLGGGPAPKRNLFQELGPNQRYEFASGKSMHFKAEGAAESDDPKALGYGMVAAGHKNIEFGGHPVVALEAAAAAYEAGAENFELEQITKQYLDSPRSGIFRGLDEWEALNAKYKELKALYAARRDAKKTAPNTALNEDARSIMRNGEEFQRLTTDSERAAYLSKLGPEKQVELAAELERRFTIDHKNNPYRWGQADLSVNQYFTQLLYSFDQRVGQRFSIELAKKQSAPDQIEAFKKIKDPIQAADFIDQIQDVNTRAKFYEQIDQMDDTNQSFRNKVRAACLSKVVDRGYRRSQLNPRDGNLLTDQRSEWQKEAKEIMRGVTHDQLTDPDNGIVKVYTENYRRDSSKAKTYTANGHADFDKNYQNNYTSKKPLPADFYGTKEGSNPDKLIKNQDDLKRYLGFNRDIHTVLKTYIDKPSLLPGSRHADQEQVIISSRPGRSN